jgi:signal transduction histidine kinase
VLSSADVLPGLLGALQRGKPACISSRDAGTDVDRTLFEQLRTDAVAVLPLFVQGRLAGVIIADNFINRQPITQARLNVLKTFAGYAGVALERSHLYDELRESIVKLQTANENLKANQQKLLQAEKLSAIGELAAYVSHEIRNPLVAIGGLARSLLRDRIESAETAETLDIIVSEVDRLERFLRDTLDFVKPRLACPESVDLNALVRDSTVTFKSQLGKGSITVHFDLSKEPLRCLIDPELFHHALSNIVRNAIEAVSSGGKIGISTRREGQAAVVWVGDTGPGIPADILPRIFDPFFTTKAEGTGLGLALASQNMRSLGGQLSLDPDREYKTRFRLTIPLEGVVQKKPRQMELEETLPGGGHENRARCR